MFFEAFDDENKNILDVLAEQGPVSNIPFFNFVTGSVSPELSVDCMTQDYFSNIPQNTVGRIWIGSLVVQLIRPTAIVIKYAKAVANKIKLFDFDSDAGLNNFHMQIPRKGNNMLWV